MGIEFSNVKIDELFGTNLTEKTKEELDNLAPLDIPLFEELKGHPGQN